MKRLVCLMILWAGVTQGQVILQDDFETAMNEMPPKGWAMWGEEKWKIKPNYVRDEAVAHGGKASFRIVHPAETNGYIVLAPERAIRAKAGMKYTIEFWAKADAAGTGAFGIGSYSSIDPFVDAPSPGFWNVKWGTAWERHEFAVTEGVDFLASQSKLLMLTFRAANDSKEARTLWIDDVAVKEEPRAEQARLTDEAKLNVASLNHRMRANSQTVREVSWVVEKPNSPKKTMMDGGGVSFHRVAGHAGMPADKDGKYTLDPAIAQAIKEARFPMTRFYGVGDEKFSVEQALDTIAKVAHDSGIPANKVVIELEDQYANKKLSPDVWARAVRHVKDKKLGFDHWEIGNEVYASEFWGGEAHGKAYPTPNAYVDHVKAVSAAIKQVDPQAKVGISIARDKVKWGNYIITSCAGSYDFVCPHLYAMPKVEKESFEKVVLGVNFQTLQEAAQLKALINAANPGREVKIIDTEWGLHGWEEGRAADDIWRNGNIMGTVHRAVRLIYYAREGMVDGASGWSMLVWADRPGFAVMATDKPKGRFMLYWLYYWFNRSIGPVLLETTGEGAFWNEKDQPSGPYTPMLATMSEDGKKAYLVIANGSWEKSFAAKVELKGLGMKSAKGICLSQSSLDASPLDDGSAVKDWPVELESSNLKFQIPAHSVLFIELQ